MMSFNARRFVAVAGSLAVIGALSFFFFRTPEQLQPDKEIHQYQASIEKGRYLAKAGNCASCHTSEGGLPYAGGLAFQTPFGLLYSTNITSDKTHGIGSWSFIDFYNAMKQGVRPDGAHLYPAFPYTAFAKMSDEDIAALYLYFQTVEPANTPAKDNEMRFPFGFRPLLAGWKMLFHDTATFVPDSSKSAEINRGAYLVEGPGHCGACHTPRNKLGAEREDLALTGGVYMDKVSLGGYRQWSAVNLTPDPTGLANWSAEHIAEYLKHGMNDHVVVHGPMNEVIMNSTHHLTDADLHAIALYLKQLPAKRQPSGATPGKEVMAEGETVYTVHCGTCHLPTGLGAEGLGVSLAGNAIVQAPDPSSLINVILYGPHLPPPPFVADRTRMKMFGKRLSDVEIAAVTSYLRQSFGNDAGAVSAEQVKQQR